MRRGAAIASIGDLKLSGEATFVFQQCRSRLAHKEGGGALSSLGDVVFDLRGNGSVLFRQCQAEGTGGGVYSSHNINISGGSFEFDACRAGNGNGHAIAAGNPAF